MNNIFCVKLKKEAAALPFPPYPGPIGQKIFKSISKEAWALWQARQTMLINEYRLNMMDATAQQFLSDEMEKFLFQDINDPVKGYIPI